MNNNFRHFLVLILPLILNGCGLVGGYHQKFDEEQTDLNNSAGQRYKLYGDQFDQFRENGKKSVKKNQEILNNQIEQTPNGYTIPSSSNISNLAPNITRKYDAQRKRIKASDLVDNDNTASLWGGQDPDSFLFTRTNFKKLGDIIQIKVAKNLKDDISVELNRRFPPPPAEEASGENNQEKPKEEKAATGGQSPEDASKIYDSISGLVIEEINKDHLLIRGRKDLLFRNRKRLVEIQALVNKKDIGDDDSILSSKLLESTITVIR